MSDNLGEAPVMHVDPQDPAQAIENKPEPSFVVGKKASELDAIFQKQSEAIKADPALKFSRHVHYAQVQCDTGLQRIPLDALSLGLEVKACDDVPGELDENFIFSLLLATGTLSKTTIDVGPDCNVDPQVVLQEAEAQGLNVRLILPADATTVESVAGYVERLERYAALWINQSSGNFSLTPLDGYLEYKFSSALGHKPKEITTNEEMKNLFTDEVPLEVMDFIKGRLDAVIEAELGGDQFFVDEVQKLGGALRLKEAEQRDARRRMLEEELDARTPVPNLIRVTSTMTGLSISDAAGMIYELKNSVHNILDKYLPKAESEGPEDAKASNDYTPSKAQYQFAQNIVAALASGFGGKDQLRGAWDAMAQKTQLKQVIDLDRGSVEPTEAAKRASETIGVEPKVVALAVAEFAAFFGAILQAGGAISEIGLERPKPVAEPVSPVQSGTIIAVG